MLKQICVCLAVALAVGGCGGPPAGKEPTAGDGHVAPVGDAAKPAVAGERATAGERPRAFAQCAACHQVEPGRQGIGPSLAGVYGAKAGHIGDYAYSAAMRDSGLTWDDATLDEYLKNPRKVVPGGKMSYAGLRDDARRAELIEWLKTI